MNTNNKYTKVFFLLLLFRRSRNVFEIWDCDMISFSSYYLPMVFFSFFTSTHWTFLMASRVSSTQYRSYWCQRCSWGERWPCWPSCRRPSARGSDNRRTLSTDSEMNICKSVSEWERIQKNQKHTKRKKTSSVHLYAVSSRDDPRRRDDGSSTQVMPVDLQTHLPWPAPQTAHHRPSDDTCSRSWRASTVYDIRRNS